MVNSDQGEEPLLTAEFFSDKSDWTSLDPTWLDRVPDGFGSALSFLSDEAICFYIPAYLSEDLKGNLKRVEPTFYLTHGFDSLSRDRRISPRRPETWTDYGKRRWSRLTMEQTSAVVHYLEWRLETDGIDLAYDASEALSAFWYDRASA